MSKKRKDEKKHSHGNEAEIVPRQTVDGIVWKAAVSKFHMANLGFVPVDVDSERSGSPIFSKDGKVTDVWLTADVVLALEALASKDKVLPDPAPRGVLIDVFVPAARAEDMLLEMNKAFEQRWLPKYGRRRAGQIYLLQSTGAVIGYWINWIKQHLDVFKIFAS